MGAYFLMVLGLALMAGAVFLILDVLGVWGDWGASGWELGEGPEEEDERE